MKYKNIREEELKNKVGVDWFKGFDTTEILGNIDFSVLPKQKDLFSQVALLWAEAKTGDYDVNTMFVQLILTIGKARTFDKTLPPAFLGAFDFKKIAFIDYASVQDIFYLNDFNWNVTPSNHETKEFTLIKERIEKILNTKTYIFNYLSQTNELKEFIKNNLAKAQTQSKIQIDKNNFLPIYLRWLEAVKPTIETNWDELKKNSILDSDFYLADLFVDDKDTQTIDDDSSILNSLFVVFLNQGYNITKENLKSLFDASIKISDKTAYTNFWKLYKRPPIKEYRDFIIERRDLLVPQDVRERKGAFFTPKIWVELSQKYLGNFLGENWQKDYYIWDCAAGTGNLLVGLSEKYNIYASTLDQADINVMHERISKGAHLLENHVFQFDFLNDEFIPQSKGGKLPDSLFKIINDPKQRKKLIIYINPPYAEAASSKAIQGLSERKTGVTTNFAIKQKLNPIIGNASNEMFVLFMAVVYEKLQGCKLGQFSTLKFINGSNFKKFKNFFLADYKDGFIVPANTFDNVTGDFPIGFTIWDTSIKNKISTIKTDIFNKNAEYLGDKTFYGDLPQSINKWIKVFDEQQNIGIGFMSNPSPDFQQNNYLYIQNNKGKEHVNFYNFTPNNLIQGSIYFAVRHCISATWLNDRDQFLYPKDGWQTDLEFQNDCLAFTLFHGQNRISAKEGVNNWIPFTEQEINAKNRFESTFLTDFLQGKIATQNKTNLFSATENKPLKIEFSQEARLVFEAGKELYSYYQAQPNANANASLYDIKEHFQGRNAKGRMNSKSKDETYTKLLGKLKLNLDHLANKIKPKIYQYEFLKP